MTTPAQVQERFVTELSLLMDPAGIYLPEEWGSVLGTPVRPNKIPYKDWTDPYVVNEFGVLHYGGAGPYGAAIAPFTVEKSMAKLVQWETMHTANTPKYDWRGLAYGFAIDELGNVFIARGFNLYGAHRGDYDNDGISANREGMPVLWIGGENNHGPNASAFAAFEMILIAAENAEGVTYTRILGHQEIIPGPDTSCPGTNGMNYVRQNRTTAAFRDKYGGAPVEPPVIEPGPVEGPCDQFPTLKLWDGWKNNIHLKLNVANMQSLLANHGARYKAANTFDSACASDGLFGNGSLYVLELFNGDNGITPRSECGPETWAKLNNL